MGTLIETRSLRREFGAAAAVDDVTLEVEEGAVLALVGPNGAGKTTLLRMIAALLEPSSGTARVDGFEVRESPREVHARLGFLPDFFGLYEELTAWEYLEYFHLAYRLPAWDGDRRIAAALAEVGLTDHGQKPIDTLSRGMRQRLGLARTLLHEPKLLLLDEPAAGLDPGARRELQDLFQRLARRGKTIVVSSHILTELEDYCSHVAMLDKGKLVFSGSVAQARLGAGPSRRFRVRAAEGLDKAKALVLAHGKAKDWAPSRNGEAVFEFSGTDAEAAGLLRELVTQGIALSGFGEVSGTIQDSYLALMGKEAR